MDLPVAQVIEVPSSHSRSPTSSTSSPVLPFNTNEGGGSAAPASQHPRRGRRSGPPSVSRGWVSENMSSHRETISSDDDVGVGYAVRAAAYPAPRLHRQPLAKQVHQLKLQQMREQQIAQQRALAEKDREIERLRQQQRQQQRASSWQQGSSVVIPVVLASAPDTRTVVTQTSMRRLQCLSTTLLVMGFCFPLMWFASWCLLCKPNMPPRAKVTNQVSAVFAAALLVICVGMVVWLMIETPTCPCDGSCPCDNTPSEPNYPWSYGVWYYTMPPNVLYGNGNGNGGDDDDDKYYDRR